MTQEITAEQYQRMVADGMSEAAFQQQVITMARRLGWRVAHFRGVRIQRRDGSTHHATPVAADGRGFPDLILIRGARLLALELKAVRSRTKVSPAQRQWIEAFAGVPGCTSAVFTAREFDQIEELLSEAA